jgi:hypothetical protein
MINSSVEGSAGTFGGNGAVITGNFIVSARTKLTVVVGMFNSTYAGGSVNLYSKGGGGGYSAVINGPSIGGNVNTNGTPIANEPSCIYIMAGGGGGAQIGSPLRQPSGGLWNSGATPRSKGGEFENDAGGYTTDDAGNGAGGIARGVGANNGSKFQGGAANNFGFGGGSGYYGGASGGGGSSYVNTSVTDVTSAATNGNAGTVTLTIVQ